MSELLDFLKKTFGTPETGIKWGTTSTAAGITVIGGLVGLLLGGGWMGALVGILAGVVGGALLADPVSQGLNITARPPVRMPKIDTKPQELSTVRQVSVTSNGTTYDLAIPELSELRKPWGNDPATYINKLGEDKLELVQDPVRLLESRKILENTIQKRDQSFYTYVATLEQYASQKAPASFPRMKLALPSDLEAESKINLDIPDTEWNQLSSTTKLQRLDSSVNDRIARLCEKWVAFRDKGEALGQKWTGPHLANVWDNAKLFIKGASTRNSAQDAAIKKFLDENGDEKTFMREMNAIANDAAVNGPEYRQIVQEQAALVVEKRRLFRQQEQIQEVKKQWVADADDWSKAVATLHYREPNVSKDTLLVDASESGLGSHSAPPTPAKSKTPPTVNPHQNKSDTSKGVGA